MQIQKIYKKNVYCKKKLTQIIKEQKFGGNKFLCSTSHEFMKIIIR